MAKKFGENSTVDFAASNLMSFGKSFATLNGQPLLKSEVWYSLDDAKAFAKTDSAYVGQKIVVVNTVDNTVKHYSIELDGELKEIGAFSTEKIYTKEETNSAIQDAISKVDHLKRKIVDNKESIDLNTEDALQYIYMVPTGLEYDDNKYYEYIVIEVTTEDEETERKLEKVGNWEVNLDGYAKTEDLKDKVDKVEGKGLSTNDYTTADKEKLASLIPIKQVDTNIFKITEDIGQLNLEAVPSEKINDLNKKTWKNQDKYVEITVDDGNYVANKYYITEDNINYVLDDSESFNSEKIYFEKIQELVSSITPANLKDILIDATETQSGFMTPIQVKKLNALVIDEDGSVGISGKVNANNVEGLNEFITNNNSIVGLNTKVGNLEDELKNYVLKTDYDSKIAEIERSIVWGNIVSE